MKRKSNKTQLPDRDTCAECSHCHSHNNKNWNNELIMGECKELGVSVLLCNRCEKFKRQLMNVIL